jgi:iron(III) transport system substrate-binding protein
MTSDLFSFEQWAREGHLASLEGTPGLDQIPPDHVRQGSGFVITRFPVMVIAYNKKRIQAGDAPKSFADLLNPRFKGQITTPSPLESGTAMTSMLYLHEKLGLSFFEGLKKNRVLSAGGNGATLSRIQSGERPVGLVLLENILESRRRGVDWVEFVIPQEGALPIPSPLAVFKSTKDLETARRVAGWFLQAEAQNILVQGGVYSPMKGAPTPPGAPDWATLNKMAWSLNLFSQWTDQKESVKAAFNRIVLQ